MKHIASIFWFILAAIIAFGAAQLLSLVAWPGLLRYLPTTVGIGVFLFVFAIGSMCVAAGRYDERMGLK